MNVVVLTGAGISQESGIKTFRDSNGLWENHSIEEVATPEAFDRNPELVYSFYNARRKQLLDPDLKPNLGHNALVELEKKVQGDFLLITQNVDNLHERAGSQNIHHMHGQLQEARCIDSNQVFPWTEDLNAESINPITKLQGTLRPNIVWFGEMPIGMDHIYDQISKCDLFLSIGTSGNVYPAAGFVQEAINHHAHTIEFNLEPSLQASSFHEAIYGKASETLTEWVSNFNVG